MSKDNAHILPGPGAASLKLDSNFNKATGILSLSSLLMLPAHVVNNMRLGIDKQTMMHFVAQLGSAYAVELVGALKMIANGESGSLKLEPPEDQPPQSPEDEVSDLQEQGEEVDHTTNDQGPTTDNGG